MQSSHLVVILEDSAVRRKRMAAVLNSLNPPAHCIVSTTTPAFIKSYPDHQAQVSLISLDHDLDSFDDAVDPGDGTQVAQYLSRRPPTSPIIVHSTNVERSELMMYLLQNAGWRVERVGPLGDDWIETSWRNTVADLINIAE